MHAYKSLKINNKEAFVPMTSSPMRNEIANNLRNKLIELGVELADKKV